MDDVDPTAQRVELHLGAGGMLQRAGTPALDFEDQQAAAGMQDHKVRLAALRADRHVVPHKVVVFEAALQLAEHAPFGAAVLGVAAARGNLGDSLRKDGHGRASFFVLARLSP